MGVAVLTEDAVRSMHRLYRYGVSVPDIAREFGVKKGTVSSVAYGLSWCHLGLDWSARPGRLDAEKVRDIRRRAAAGESLSTLAAECSVSRKWIEEIVAGRAWTSVA